MQNPTEAEVYSRLIERLRLAEEASYALGHFYKAQDASDAGVGQGFLAVGEMLKLTQYNVTRLAMKGQTVRWPKSPTTSSRKSVQ